MTGRAPTMSSRTSVGTSSVAATTLQSCSVAARWREIKHDPAIRHRHAVARPAALVIIELGDGGTPRARWHLNGAPAEPPHSDPAEGIEASRTLNQERHAARAASSDAPSTVSVTSMFPRVAFE
jgi:hypothetical protein